MNKTYNVQQLETKPWSMYPVSAELAGEVKGRLPVLVLGQGARLVHHQKVHL